MKVFLLYMRNISFIFIVIINIIIIIVVVVVVILFGSNITTVRPWSTMNFKLNQD